MNWATSFILISGLVSANNLDHTKQKSLTQFFNFDDVCPSDGMKREINLKTGMAVFTFDESSIKTREKLKLKDFKCHLELETYPGHGFHVYFDQMDLDKDQAVCKDFVRFERDVLFVTNFKSQKYCGLLPRKDLSLFEPTNGVSVPRLYVEETDSEMDIWLNIRQTSDEMRQPRKLTLVVTVFKTGCGPKDNYFRQCPSTQNCVRREFFCDGHASCTWPDGEVAADEMKKCEDFRSDMTSSSTIFSASNIPVIIIVIIVVLALLVIFFIACNRFIGMVKKPTEGEEDRGLRMPLGQTAPDLTHTDVCLRTFSDCQPSTTTSADMAISGSREAMSRSNEALTRLPSMPPSYDEVVKSYGGVVPSCDASPTSAPPPYSLTTTDI